MKKFKLSKKLLLIAGIVILIIGGIFWRRSVNKPVYQEYTVEKRDLRDALELSGQVTAATSATLRFPAGGLVTYLGAKEGDTVKKWQTLASLDTRQLQKTLEQKLNLYAIQRGTFDQTVDDNDNSIPGGELGLTLRRLFEKNQYQLENTVKDVEYQALSLQLSRIYSPVAGVLVHSPVTVPNVTVTATDTWVVVDPNTLQFVADLDETDLTKVSVGQKVIITLDAYPDKNIESTVSTISYSPVETTAGTTYDLKVKLPAAEMANLRLGLNGTAAIVLTEKPAVTTLPSSALRVENGSSYVLVLTSGKYEKKPIETGIEYAGWVEVKSGLGAGDHVYTEK